MPSSASENAFTSEGGARPLGHLWTSHFLPQRSGLLPSNGCERPCRPRPLQEATCQIQTACAVAFSRDVAAASRMTPDTVLYATTQADFAAGVQASFNPCSSVQSKAAPTVS